MKKTRKIVESRIMRAVLCVLCAACIICAGCSGGMDDNTTGSDDGTTTPDNEDDEKKPDEPTVETPIFDLHCFTEGVKTFSVGGGHEGSAKFQSEYTQKAQKYIKEKFADLQKQMQKENPTENTFKTVLNDALNLKGATAPYNTPEALTLILDRGIPVFYQETAKYIAQIINNLDESDQAKFQACYDHLAAQAYDASLTIDKTSDRYNDLMPIKGEKEEIAAELSKLHIDDKDAEETLKNLLDKVADKNNINKDTLKDSVNLAFDINGLYGLRDSVAIQGGFRRKLEKVIRVGTW